MQKRERQPFLVRYPVADTWPEFFGRMAMVVLALGLVAVAFVTAH